MGAFVAIGIIGYAKGDPRKLGVPYDPDGNGCGLASGQAKDFPYLYYTTPWSGYFHRYTCLKSCPNFQNDSNRPNALECLPNSVVTSCQRKDVTISSLATVASDNNFMNTSVFVYNTTALLGRFCFPAPEYLKKMNVSVQFNFGQIEEYMTDLKTVWPIFLACLGISFVIGFVYMIFLRFCSGIMTWLAILAYLATLIFLAILLWREGVDYQSEYDETKKNNSPNEDLKKKAYALKGIAIALFAVFGISFLFFLCAFNKIRIAIAIVKTASLFIADVKSVLFVPPFFILIFAILWAFWITAALYYFREVETKNRIPVASIKWDDTTRKMVIYFIFAGLWANAFISALNQFVVASACCIWYFAQSNAHMPVTKSFYRAFRYHLGSLAMGAFILAVVQFIRLILEYIQYNLEKYGAKENALIKFILNCCRCYMACFERFIKFLNKNAYIQIALTGKNFCRSAWNAFSLIIRNPLKFGVVGGLGEVFILIGKIVISASTTLICYLIITRVDTYSISIELFRFSL